ncbi:hypothetical protein LguiB_034821 [Lonicera macranthoides]
MDFFFPILDIRAAIGGKGLSVERWRWSRPDVNTYTLLVQGLAASLKVSDALRIIANVCRVGVSPAEEVPFGKIVRCPSCMIAVAVAQPQHGSPPAERSMDVPAWKRGLRFLPIMKQSIPAAVHSIVWHFAMIVSNLSPQELPLQPSLGLGIIFTVRFEALVMFKEWLARKFTLMPFWGKGMVPWHIGMAWGCNRVHFLKFSVIWFVVPHCGPIDKHFNMVQTPSGMARTHRFATETVDLPAQEGERVTIALAAPSNIYREVGPLKFSPKAPNFYPGEPMCLTNHINGRESPLLRAPTKNEGASLLNPSILFPLLAVLGTGDAASRIIDPSLPQLISVAAVSSLAVGATLNILVLPQLNRSYPELFLLPQRFADTVAIRQQLLSQYDTLQVRIKDLKQAAENEVWMLARMCQLENKIFAVGEPSYRARRSRVKKVREGLESSLKSRIELIESYARISSMIEIEVEMDSDVLAAEAASNVRWRLQAEANDEVERLLSTEPLPTEQAADR